MLTNAQKYRNEAYFDNMYTRLRCFLDYTVSTTVRNLNSLCRDSLAQIEERSSSIVWYKLLRVKVQKVHFSWTKVGFADPYLRNLNLICRCGMYIETLPFQRRIFSYLLKFQYGNICWACSASFSQWRHSSW